MRSADYPYPPDEFDAAAASGPRGVHRTPQPSWHRWWPFVVALVVLPALAYAAVTFLADWDPSGGSTQGGATPSASATQDATTGETPSETATETPTETPSETPTETPTPTVPPVDLARTVRIDNATTTSGLAGGARDELETAGFGDVSTGNWDGDDVGTTAVFYPDAADEGTAAQVAAVLGIARVELNAELAADQVLVVLESDYQP